MQLSLVCFAFATVVIGSATSSSIPILSLLTDAPTKYRPTGQLYRLPLREKPSQPGLFYGFGPQVPEVIEATTKMTTELPTTSEPITTTEKELEKENIEREKEEIENFDKEGIYYIYHPDGLLQKVTYGTKVEDMGYTAKLTYKDVEPIKEPIFTYDPETLAFAQLAY